MGLKLSKREVNYTDHASNHDERCELCKHYRKPDSCQIVEGKVSDGGWCEMFERK